MRLKKRFFVISTLVLAGILFYKINYEIPILMYHQIAETDGSSSLVVSPKAFEAQMEYLKTHRFRVMSLEDIIGHIRLGQAIPSNAVAITFDDGTLDNFENAFPVLKKMGFPATIFMITENIGKKGWLSAEDIKILDSSGISIGSHTRSHAFLPDLSKEKMVTELHQSRNNLEKILGHPVFLFSYPAGGVTREAKTLVAQAGYRGAVTTNYGKKPKDVYALRRIKVTDAKGNLFHLWAKASGLYHLGKKRIPIQ